MKADWLGVREALARVVSGVPILEAEKVPLADARGRILAEDIVAPIDVPRWTNSAMDGFAVRAADIAGASSDNPIELPVFDDIPAGRIPEMPLPPGATARVMTGAQVPEGADSVVRIEHTDGGINIGGAGARVRIFDTQDAGKNLRFAGEDVGRGDVALPRGMVLSSAAIGLAASLGQSSLSVIRRPEVALLTSGDELVEVDRFEEVLAGGKIVSSNSYTLAAQLEEAGCRVRYLGIADDSEAAICRSLEEAAGCDAVITSAGISVGVHDHVKSALRKLDTRVAFWRVRMRPGSPFAFGHIDGLGGIPWFGLPGNPVSSMVTFELFARPALLRMSGFQAVYPRPVPARLLEDVGTQPGLTLFPRVRLTPLENGFWGATTTGAQGSGVLSSLAHADGLLVITEDRTSAQKDDVFPVIPLTPSTRLLIDRPGF